MSGPAVIHSGAGDRREEGGVITVALHPELVDAFVRWLDSRRLDLSPPIPAGDGTTFHVVVPRDLGRL